MVGNGVGGKTSFSKPLLVIAIIALVVGIVLRIASFQWNDRLQGDVNLFALTAREFVLRNRLYYPMRFEYSDYVDYRSLASPASYHPPLWSLVGGLLGKVLGTDDTFPILKAMCEVVGAGLIFIVIYGGVQGGWTNEALVTISCLSLSSILVDFSANGSLYILSATFLVLTGVLLERFNYQKIKSYILAGVLCAVAFQVHSMLVCIPVAFFIVWFWSRRQLNWKGLLAFALVALVLLAPWMIWNMSYYGKPFYSYSSNYFMKGLGLVHECISGDVITTCKTGPPSMETLRLYSSIVFSNVSHFLFFYLIDIGPITAALATFGCFTIIKRDVRKASAILIPFLLCCAMILFWASFKYRFLVPVLPVTYLVAAFGWRELFLRVRSSLFLKLIGWLCLLGMILWGAWGFFERVPTRYYWADSYRADQYAEMLSLTEEMKQLEPGVILGYSNSLDGGFETIYWHRLPYVYGRGLGEAEIQKLVRDFDVRYIWVDEGNLQNVESYFPEARVILHNGMYYVFELPR